MSHRIRHLATSLLPSLAPALALAVSFAFAGGNAQGADLDEVWSVVAVVKSTPKSFDLSELYVVPCAAPDWKLDGGEMFLQVVDAEGQVSEISMVDPRMVFVELPEEGSRWAGDELVQVGDRYMFPNAVHVFAISVGNGAEMPVLPARLKFESSAKEILFEADVTFRDVVPADYFGCGTITPPPPTNSKPRT